ncbi:putative membrane protein YccC [Metabacillus crassostreae]|uniref:hypothetical protein n=1 Tax=Metabacillus crassostreae TaxID=929098 RepID=UPI001EF80D1F|nr:hypothetical protein [Metabacillus crassostreae]MBM7602825.1 putative membrane protein YccC [Metabacillus crassostreae]
MKQHVEKIKAILNELKRIDNKKINTRLDLNKCERVIDKLGTLASNCQECEQQLVEFENHYNHILENNNQLQESDYKHHKKLIRAAYSHLQKNHKLLPEGYYLSLFLSVGMSIGVMFGLTIFDNIALGLPIGMCMGIAIGAGLDADAKKNGKTI